MNKKKPRLEPLEEGLLTAMQAVCNQIAREMQRSPAERDEQGVLKWEPYTTRVERIAPFILNSIGDGEVDLDAVIVFSQAFVKALQIYVQDLGPDGLGNVRLMYCQGTLEKLENDIVKAMGVLRSSDQPTLN